MPPKAGRGVNGRGRGKKMAAKTNRKKRKAEEIGNSGFQDDREEGNESQNRCGAVSRGDQDQDQASGSAISQQHSPSLPSSRNTDTNTNTNRQPEASDDEDSVSPTLITACKTRSKPQDQVDNGKGDKGKGKAQNKNLPPGPPYSLTEAQEEEIAHWVESKKLLYDMKDKQYKDKALRRKLWEGKAAEYGMDYDSIQRWYHTQRTRFSKLPEGQPKKKSQKRSGNGLSSGDEEDPILAEEASENDSDRDKFIRRVLGFLRPHIRRHKKDTPASFKDKLALAETGELAWSDDSTIAGNLADEPREPTKKYTGYPTPRPPSRTRRAAEDRPESPTMEMRVPGASSQLQDRLVQFITREQEVSRATPFCKYLETELNRLHDACLEPAYEEITTVLNHYRKVSRQFRMREVAGDQISPLEDVPSAFELQQYKQQGPAPVIPVCTSATYSRVRPLQQESALPSGTYCRAASSPSAEFQPDPSQWPRNPPPASVWRSQECGYVEKASQQYFLEQQQQQQYHTLQPASTATQGYVRRSDSSVVWESQKPRPSMPMVTRAGPPSPRQATFFQLPSQPPQQQIRGPRQLTPQQPVQRPSPPPLSAQQSVDSLSQYLKPADSVNINKDSNLSPLVPRDNKNDKSQ